MNIPIQNIYIMLIYSWQKHNEKDIVNVDLEGQTNLQDLFAKVLINGINHLFKEESIEITELLVSRFDLLRVKLILIYR